MTTYSDGKHESRLDCVFANTTALRAVSTFEVSQEQAVPTHKLLLVEIDLLNVHSHTNGTGEASQAGGI